MGPEASPSIQEAFSAAMGHHQAGRLNEAERLYLQILKADPGHADTLHLLGVLAHQIGRNDLAVDLIGRAIAQNGRVPAFHNNLGNALKAQGKLQEAAACYSMALVHRPNHVGALFNLGLVLQMQGKLEEAAASYRRALRYQPDYAEALGNLGNTLQTQGKLQEAVGCYERALAHRPDYAEAHSNLGNVLMAQGRYAAAAASHVRALTHKPDYAEAHNNLGLVLLEQGNVDAAVASYRRALTHKPDYAEAHNNLGNALREQGQSAEAAVSYRRALALDRDNAEARLGLATAMIPVFMDTVAESIAAAETFASALTELIDWSSANPGRLGKSVGGSQPFYLAYRPTDVTALLSRYGDLVCSEAAAHWRPGVVEGGAARPPRERIRITIVSGQVRQHPVWDVSLRGIVTHLDRRRFEVVLYHTGSITDEETTWARGRVDRFVQGPRSTRAWLDEVARDRPEVMFYPEVGMDPATCALAALRLAPLQVAGWGHPVTTGLPSIDLFVSGELLEGTGAERHYREKLIRLPGTGVCTDMTPVQSLLWGGPPRQGNCVRFALCQQPIKFDPADDVLLTRIAKAVGPSEFWLADPKKLHWATARLRNRLAAAFRAEGLDPDAHLRVMPWLSRDQFAGFLDEMDVFLDCPAFSGYTTAWQALPSGISIVTLEGEFLRQRLAAGLLRQIGMTDGIASSADQYVQIAALRALESRDGGNWDVRRESMRRAATQADGNRAAVSAFEQALTDALKI
ncbi:MAG TPA: tetratricopeptide repeat protein [Steroidobacteraceae bacterium]|nr:tetratricopeptide repeat protein [Steroidobacteraceae bacterium]